MGAFMTALGGSLTNSGGDEEGRFSSGLSGRVLKAARGGLSGSLSNSGRSLSNQAAPPQNTRPANRQASPGNRR